MEKLDTLLVDLDDVLALDGFLNIMNVFLGTNYAYQDINGYYVENVMTKEQLIEYRKFLKTHNVYDYAVVAPHSKEALRNLMLYYNILIGSSFNSELDNIILPELIPEKCEFLMRNYPFLPSKNFIFTNDKSIIKADIRIDDKLGNLTSGIKLLYPAHHNKDISDIELSKKEIIRVNDWYNIEDILIKRKKK